MMLILSEQTDATTDVVCSWLNHYGCDYLRVNEEDAHNPHVEIRIKDGKFTALYSDDSHVYDLSDVEICWYRRGFFKFHVEERLSDVSDSTNESITRFLGNEGKTLENFFYFLFGKKLSINHPANYNFNKLIALHEAADIGFKIPNTLLCRHSADLKKFVDENGSCITKSIQDIMPIRYGDRHLSAGKIERVDKRDLAHSEYWYSLFQKEIPKRYELRVFYFLGKQYAMAIFSQLDCESRLDFRDVDVNGDHPNRMVPYNLPKNIKTLIHKLMKRLKLESGSLDIIVTPDNDYYFLEVNPVGQFNFVSEICNYYIEKDIAKHLSQWKNIY